MSNKYVHMHNVNKKDGVRCRLSMSLHTCVTAPQCDIYVYIYTYIERNNKCPST